MTWTLTREALPPSLQAGKVQLRHTVEGSSQSVSILVDEADLRDLQGLLALWLDAEKGSAE